MAGRRALVVGGTGGIGAAVALALAEHGAEVTVTGRGRRQADAVSAADCAPLLSTEAPARVSLTIEKPSDLIDRLPEFGPLDILVMAFGPFVYKPLDRTDTADWERTALLNLALPGAAASALLPGMQERQWGRFIFFGGTRTDAIRAYSGNAAYAAAKTGLAVLVKSIAANYADRNIGAVLLCPGFVETEYQSAAQKAELAAKAPGARLIQPAAIAEFAAGLAAQDPCLASGAVINLDGGLKIGT